MTGKDTKTAARAAVSRAKRRVIEANKALSKAYARLERFTGMPTDDYEEAERKMEGVILKTFKRGGTVELLTFGQDRYFMSELMRAAFPEYDVNPSRFDQFAHILEFLPQHSNQWAKYEAAIEAIRQAEENCIRSPPLSQALDCTDTFLFFNGNGLNRVGSVRLPHSGA